MVILIHTFELLLVVTYFDIRHLFSMYGIKVDKYHYFGAAVEQLNEEIKKVFPSYAVSYIWDQATGDCNLQLKVDAVKMLSRGTIVEDDYVLVEADIRKFLSFESGT